MINADLMMDYDELTATIKVYHLITPIIVEIIVVRVQKWDVFDRALRLKQY